VSSSGIINSADEKKNRIELLKQKYLKKGGEVKGYTGLKIEPSVI